MGGGGDGRIREFAEGARSEGVNRWAFSRTTRSGVSEDPTNYQSLPKSDSREAAKQTGVLKTVSRRINLITFKTVKIFTS